MPYMNRCGDGENRLAIGINEPFEPATTQTEPDGVERHQFSVYEGHQGGYHIDVSIRIEGGIDPDLVNVRLRLNQGEADTPVATHAVDEWYLKLTDDREHCEYPQARLVFAETSGQLMSLDDVTTLLNTSMTLAVTIEASDQSVAQSFDIIATEIIRLE